MEQMAERDSERRNHLLGRSVARGAIRNAGTEARSSVAAGGGGMCLEVELSDES